MKRRRPDIVLSDREIQEFKKRAEGILGPGSLAETEAAYELFKYKSPDGQVSLVFYQHRKSTGNHGIRVRDNGSKDKKTAGEIMDNFARHSPSRQSLIGIFGDIR
jgi:hypothetical protein